MSEVDDNLNYMLGQLSLVVSEFNQVTTLTLIAHWQFFCVSGFHTSIDRSCSAA